MQLSSLAFFARLKWIDGRPLRIESYRQRLFDDFFDKRDDAGRLRYNLLVAGRSKKNWKSADLALAALFCLVSEPPTGYDADCYVLANDGDQARDDLSLAKKIVKANRILDDALTCRKDVIERKDGRGFLEILPAGDVAGSHGKSYRFCGYDEIHGYRTWDILEAMQPDPHRADAQVWITSYASIFHRPGVPLFDLMQAGWAGRDPRMLFSWYAAQGLLDPAARSLPPGNDRTDPS
jgi:phage terminase large subunit-like protein